MDGADRTLGNMAMFGTAFLVFGPQAAHDLAEKLGEKPAPMGPWTGRDASVTPLLTEAGRAH